ncbi:MAG: hypothetical protein ABI480_06015 [Chitinophagaceae bacterium]
MKNFVNKGINFALTIGMVVLLGSCGSQRIVTTWKTDHVSPTPYKKIMVVAILPDKDSVLRKTTEDNFVSMLEQLGYKAFSALAEYGQHGLRNSGQENTYLKLYRNGTDAVLTVALIEKKKQNFHRRGEAYIHPNSFYYKRIWDYKNIQEADMNTNDSAEPEFFWESIVFDLSTLEAACTVRTEPFANTGNDETNSDMARRILKKITKENILPKQKAQKAF